MKKSYAFKALLPVTFSLLSLQIFSQNAWFNEIHYDNASTDVGEFIEVVVQNPGDYDLVDFSVVLYNGSSSQRKPYNTKTLDEFTPGETIESFTTFCYDYPSNGIQNGAPDGLCLVHQGVVLQFLSYEGTFIAAEGPAVGMESIDIGVSESNSTPAGQSLQLQGEGSAYADFFWTGPIDQTNCTYNTGQTMVEPVAAPLSDWAIIVGILLIGLFTFLRLRRNS
jgi:hypothetical protein